MNDDSEAAAKLSKAVHDIEALLHPPIAQPATTQPAPLAIPAPSGSKVNRFCSIVFIVAIVNFVAFLIGASVLRGDAVNGKTEAGRYYVADHGKLTEVSKAAFTYSRFHYYTLWVTHPMAMICALVCYVPKQSKRTK
ncbi:hypothetical protein EV701_14126 [Chthoniobacter flavus]|nr:hypothetical protein [Chthoniobacter flavus]TCO83613.1 hypothetical protein EV701_14126 [Chthoniobacter flavus]